MYEAQSNMINSLKQEIAGYKSELDVWNLGAKKRYAAHKEVKEQAREMACVSCNTSG